MGFKGQAGDRDYGLLTLLREVRWLAPAVSQSAISPGILADFALVLRMHDSNTRTKA